MGETVNLDRVGGTHVSGADVVDPVNSAIRVNLVAGAGGGGGPATIADGADVTQGAKADAAWVSGDGTVVSLLKKIASAGGSAVSIADGSDVAQGTTTDAAVVTDVAGTLSAKLRGLVKIFADIWDSVNHRFRVDGSGVTQPISAAVLPLPAGAAIGTKQDTGNASLASIDGKIAVVNTAAVVVSSSVLPANAAQEAGGNLATLAAKDFSTSAKQDTGNTSLGSIKTNTDIPTTAVDSRVSLVASGVPQQLPSVGAKLVAITADVRNQLEMVIGGATVVADRLNRTGIKLDPGDTAILPVTNLNQLYINGLRPFDAVSYAVLA